VLRSVGFNKEDDGFIRAELRHHTDVVTTAIAENLDLPLAPDLHHSYVKIADLIAVYVESGHTAVELALTDAAAGAANFEHFRGEFSELEELMDKVRDVLHDEVAQVRKAATAAATLSKQMIVGSCVAGVLLLALITMIAVRIAQRITAALASSREEAHHLALHDVLTGLPNRAFLAARLEQVLADAQRNETMVAVLCLDLDRFKQVNDTLGHPIGDLLLRIVADRLRACVRKCDTVVRLGGDEFAIIQAPLARLQDAATLAERVVMALSEPYDLNGHQVVAGASVGIALVPADTNDPTHLLKMADLALYRAKQEGRGTFRMFEPGMDTKLQARRMLELDLRRAVMSQEFELHYQPLVDVASGEVTALEALVRWRHPERGLVPPNDFIPLAEETGLIGPIGAWVLEQACMDAAQWPTDKPVAVNISAAQFKGCGLVAVVEHALATAALSPARLELEITETALIADADSTLEVLRELRAMGIRIAMDDFGTGYSSLGYLRSFPFDKIKIDRCFVKDIETNPDCKAIVRAVTGLSSNLGIVTTAEGVVTFAELAQLRAEGCDQVQGYFFSRPVPAAEVTDLLNCWLTDVPERPAAGKAETVSLHQ
jgi:diguanylate cyclase (GGDEF)-like protein